VISLAAAERLEEIKQHNEPIEETSESQASASASSKVKPKFKTTAVFQK
jgi:hypothetical protein